MNSDQSEDLIRELCENGGINDALKKYMADCSPRTIPAQESKASSDGNSNQKKEKKQEIQKGSFPNLAGFCRYLNVGTDELEHVAEDYPSQYGRILAVLEDEALNSGLSPTLISAYMKKRLRYDLSTQRSSRDEQLHISFEHDIFEDGE